MEKINYEKSVARLEEIVDKLESGNLSLEEMMKLYEEGVSLIRLCTQKLESAEQSVKILQMSEEGIALADFDGKGDKA